MDISADRRIHLQQQLEDAGFSRPDALRLARASADDPSGRRADRIAAALDELHFPAGPAAESVRARLWQDVFQGPVDDASGDAAPEPGWYAGTHDAGIERYWDGTGWTGRLAASPAGEYVADATRGTVLMIIGFCLGVVALVITPLVPGSLAVALASVVVSTIGLGSPAAALHGGVRALGTAGLVLGIIALVQVLSVHVLPGTAATPFGVMVP
ncbi:DUF2510 domain-containing protein [Arthrobacter bussei]|uniref:DUF2510 domain-containing protein n=1 Tax=Arthrobacter bussei TaxID=2594179 RepID=A0A7X1TNX5_9MICC|nr:DUF2510 domain-containing protein [Arthrobacter bussei]MPY11229.1 DUF2510 domain-containing protein [Arthrobacter bussei]